MECRGIEEKISAYIDDQLFPEDKILVEEHLKTCAKCRILLEELKQTIALVEKLEDVEPPPWLEQKIMAKVREDAGQSRGFFKKLFFPMNIKVPMQAVASIALAVTAFFIFKSIEPDVKKAAVDVKPTVIEEMKAVEPPAAQDVTPLQEQSLVIKKKRNIMKLSDDRGAFKQESKKAAEESLPAKKKFNYEPPPMPVREPVPGPAPMIGAAPGTARDYGDIRLESEMLQDNRSAMNEATGYMMAKNIFTITVQAVPATVNGERFMEDASSNVKGMNESFLSGAYLSIDLKADAIVTHHKEPPFFVVRLKAIAYNLYLPPSLLGPLRTEVTDEAMSLVDVLNTWIVEFSKEEFMQMRKNNKLSFTISEPFKGLRNFEQHPVEVSFPWKDEWQ